MKIEFIIDKGFKNIYILLNGEKQKGLRAEFPANDYFLQAGFILKKMIIRFSREVKSGNPPSKKKKSGGRIIRGCSIIR